MKKITLLLTAIVALFALAVPVCAASLEQMAAHCESMRLAMIIMLAILGLLVLASVILTVVDLRKGGRYGRGARFSFVTIACYLCTILVLVVCVFCFMKYQDSVAALNSSATTPAETTHPITQPTTQPTTEPITEPTTEPTEPPTEPTPTLAPGQTSSSDPSNWSVDWQLFVDGQKVDSFQRPETIDFGAAEDYYPLPGVSTFRGDNYRTGASYGIADISTETLKDIWVNSVGSLDGWPGVGWTGQPLCVQWDDQTKSVMGLYDSKKTKDGLVEVICTTLDGYIYFYDLEDGSKTRDPIWIGMSFKGTASLDPRGYPILYAGSGLIYGKNPRMYAISLVDNSIIWEQSGGDELAYRGWYAFDSSPMISAETDTLIWGCESGMIYTIKLNTQYDPQTGALSMDPQTVVKTRYKTNTGHTIGFESSVIVVGPYAFIGDNGGMFFCFDLNTMELIWAQNTRDDVNATPVFEWGEDGKGYLYTATSMEYGGGTSYIYKIDAATGEILWEKSYGGITYDKDVSGGILGSPILGKPGTNLEGMIIYPVAKTPSAYSGILFALDTDTGEVIWEEKMSNYTWSSPVSLYTENGKGYLVLGDAGGYLHLMDAATGETLDSIGLGANMEASPIAFENYIVIGTRGCQIYGVKVQ